MKRLTPLVIAASLAGLTFTVPLTAIAQTSVTTSQPSSCKCPSEQVSMLYVLRAQHGVITHDSTGYTLTLSGMDTDVSFFSDRPARKAGVIPLSTFIEQWSNGSNSFGSNPPNAVFLHHVSSPTESRGYATGATVVLSNPVATEDGWSFHIQDLTKEVKTGSFDGIRLFIDSDVVTMPVNAT